LTCRVQSKDLPTGLVVGHSGTVIVAEAAEAVGLGGDDRGRDARTDARLTPDKREPLAVGVAAVKEPTGVLARLAAAEAGDVKAARLVITVARSSTRCIESQPVISRETEARQERGTTWSAGV